MSDQVLPAACTRLPPSPLTSYSFITIVAYLMMAAFVLLIDKVGGDPGLGWHLKTGEFIVSTRSIPYVDPFLVGMETQRWICNQWLSDVILYCVFSAFSWVGVHLACFLIAFSAYCFVLAPTSLDSGRSVVPQNIGFAIAVLCGSLHWITRPVVFSLLGFAVVDWLIRSQRSAKISNSAFIILLIPLFALWANLHPAFLLGLVLLGLSAIFETINAPFAPSKVAFGWIALAAAVASSGINPNGFALHASAIELGRSEFFMNLNIEWLPPSLSGYQFFPFYVAVVVGAIGGFKFVGNGYSTLKAVFFMILSFKGARFIPFFGIAAFPAVEHALRSIFAWTNLDKVLSTQDSSPSACIRAIVPGLALMVSAILLLPSNEARIGLSPHFPIAAIKVAFADLPNSQKPAVFHTPDWGGAIIWTTYPRRLAWIDDRNELNGEQKYRDFILISGAKFGWKEKLDELGFKRAILDPKAPLVSALQELPTWRRVFEDKRAVVFERL